MATTIKGSGTATGMARLVDGVKLASGLWLADITDAIGVATFDYRTGAVPEFTFDAVDRDRKLSRRGLLREGTSLTFEGVSDVWQIAAVERQYRGDDIWLTFTARSRLSRRLRNMTGPKTWKNQTPQAVLTSLVKKAGGTARVEPGAGRMQIVQKRNQSVLDVISSVASDTGVEWVEVDGVIYVGTPWWAFTEDLGLPTWNVRLDGNLPRLDTGNALAMLDFSSRSSLDDRANAAEAQLVVESRRGSRVRPWHLVNVLKADDADNGDWLVSGVGFDEVSGSASIDLLRPLKSSPKKASQGTSDSSSSSTSTSDGSTPTMADLDAGPKGWIKGADKVWPNCTRTPKQYTSWALGQILTPFPNNRCLAWVSIAVSGREGRGGLYAKYVWEKAPASAVKAPGDTNPPAGAIVVWGPPTGGNAGHIGISIGQGKFISATGGKVVIRDIAGFGSYYGAMTPSFYV